MLNSLPHNDSRVAVPRAGPCAANIAIASADICREYCSSHKYSKLKYRALPICSLPCDISIVCKVCGTARATFAAPTFFPVLKIQDRFIADGGLGHNNPSFGIYYHYTRIGREASSRQIAASTSEFHFAPHGDLDCSRVGFPNIGSGANTDGMEPRKREWLAGLLPGVTKNSVFLKQTLTDTAGNSKEKIQVMRIFQELNQNVIMFERSDASHGLSNIKLDAYNGLQDIKGKTRQRQGKMLRSKRQETC